MWQAQGLYSQYLLRTPVLLTGKESVMGLYNYPGERFAVIHGNSISDKNRILLKRVFKKKEVHFFKRSWDGEPALKGLYRTVHELEEYKPDVIIAFGGGSVIDGAKLCRLLYEFPFFDANRLRIDGSGLKTKFIAIPTTIGSGAEVSSAAVYWDTENHKKEMVVIHELQPDVVVYDVEYVKGTPNRILYASALDGMSHIIEGYVSKIKNSIAEVLGEKGLDLFFSALSGSDLGVKEFERLQYAGYMGGIVQNHCIVGAAHAVAHQLTGYGYSHGEAVGILLPCVIRKNMSDDFARKQYEALAVRTGFGRVENLLIFLQQILIKSGIQGRQEELKNLLTKHLSDEEMLNNIINDRSGKGNPVPITNEYIEEMVRSL